MNRYPPLNDYQSRTSFRTTCTTLINRPPETANPTPKSQRWSKISRRAGRWRRDRGGESERLKARCRTPRPILKCAQQEFHPSSSSLRRWLPGFRLHPHNPSPPPWMPYPLPRSGRVLGLNKAILLPILSPLFNMLLARILLRRQLRLRGVRLVRRWRGIKGVRR